MPELHNDTPQMWTYYHFLRSTVTDPFIFQFTLICHSIINLQNSLFQVICISLKFCCMDKLCILVLFNLSKSFLKLFNHLTNLTIVSDNANFVLFLHLLNEMVLLLSPIVCRRPDVKLLGGPIFYHQYIHCTHFSSSHYLRSNQTTFHQSFS